MFDTQHQVAIHHRVLRALAPFRRFDWSLIGMILVIKLVVLVFGAVSFQIFQDRPIWAGGGWLGVWNQWDTPHYLNLAQYGYQPSGEMHWSLVFFPLLPWLTRLVTVVTGNYLASTLVISTVASIFAGVLLYRLFLLDFPAELVWRSVWFMFIFPTSYFLHIGYTESLFIALTLGCFWAARRDRWWLVGILGVLAGLTRINGLVLIPALGAEALHQYWKTRHWNWGWLAIGGAALGFAGYLLINLTVTGSPFTFLSLQHEHWFKELAWPWVGIAGTIRSIFWRPPAEAHMVGVQELIFITLSFVATIWCCLRLRPSYAVWMAGNWLLFTSTSYILSAPRYTLIFFPIYLLFAQLAAHHIWNVLLTTWSLLFLALFVTLFVQGRWAF
jgi:Gpi18-like mannosyltransferase